MPGRPNLVFITSDQQRGDCYGFEGRKVKTPHLDRMARAGTRFSACITPNLVCQPSRASILTGLLPYTHGVSDNGIDLDPKVGEAGFAGAFAGAGYRTGYIGKAHFATSHTFKPTGTPECRNSDQDPDWYGPYMGFEHVELVVEGHNHWPPMKPPRG
ncbi:MAG TPA: sulfatase-like hydrolase/transferase, partial [Burkholderiales bacterium]|nr:sulfatase-like hydrolase/transferase [Burkholderiales bacterium]